MLIHCSQRKRPVINVLKLVDRALLREDSLVNVRNATGNISSVVGEVFRNSLGTNLGNAKITRNGLFAHSLSPPSSANVTNSSVSALDNRQAVHRILSQALKKYGSSALCSSNSALTPAQQLGVVLCNLSVVVCGVRRCLLCTNGKHTLCSCAYNLRLLGRQLGRLDR